MSGSGILRDGGTGQASGPIVLACAATGIVPFIERAGGDIDSIFGNSGIAPDMAGSPTLKLKLGDYCRLFEEASRRTQRDNFGLWFGNQFQPRDLGLWGYAAVSSPTLGSALENLVGLFRYHQESSVMRLIPARDGLIRLEYRIEAPEILERRQDAELSLGMLLNLIRECMGAHWAPEEVHFEHPRPQLWQEHESAFAAPVYFSQPTNALAFRRELLDRAMPAADLKLLAVMQTSLEALGLHGGGQGLSDRIRSAIRVRLPNGYPALDQIAAELRVSAPLVQRTLAEQGLTYKDAVEVMRRNLAMMYLEQRQLPLTEVALLLGYSELSAFTRAFTRWTGASPRSYRQSLVRH
ncbi:MAG TPA: AraC family transcriptional regulator [Candidatus Cybelea sp.]|nr:AraC family transcriptional regulator [Candidatus Cybelea sp.]